MNLTVIWKKSWSGGFPMESQLFNWDSSKWAKEVNFTQKTNKKNHPSLTFKSNSVPHKKSQKRNGVALGFLWRTFPNAIKQNK